MTSMLPPPGEHLTNGWEPDLDPADSLVRQAVLAHVSWGRAVARAGRGDLVEGAGWAAGRSAAPSALLNWAIVTAPPLDWGRVAEEVRDVYPEGTQALVVSPFPAPDLTAHGLQLVGHPPLMLRPTATVTQTPRTAVDLHEATPGPSLVDAERVLIEGYPLPDLTDSPPGDFYRPEFLDPATRVFVAYDDGVPVATSAAHSAAGVTVVENVAVLPTARGKGAGAAITWAATRAWPEQPAVLIASDDGQPVYERLGYLRLTRWTAWLLA